MFTLPKYQAPDFTQAKFAAAPEARTGLCEIDGVAPEGYHATSIFPEYFKLGGAWALAEESRMDAVVVLRETGVLDVVETRYLRRGDRVLLGRGEHCREGIYLHTGGFGAPAGEGDQFAFRTGRSRETAYSRDYDHLYDLLRHEREHGNVVWVAGPAFAFDADARRAMQSLVEGGYVHGLLAGNALAVHDLEAGYLRTALGQDIYTQASRPNGHYNHLDTINRVRACGSVKQFIENENITDGIMYGVVRRGVPFVLTGSIRDDGPLPETVADTYEGQARMRALVRKATTVICLATQLHTIAAGNMTPAFRVVGGVIRPLYLYSIDISEFVVNKLRDRGSLSAVSLVTNVQDFIVNVAKGLGVFVSPSPGSPPA
jgi:lysine-ketoglutarate reductase/saccharopine dehydrogenase-like protein (TIGR00300 family)